MLKYYVSGIKAIAPQTMARYLPRIAGFVAGIDLRLSKISSTPTSPHKSLDSSTESEDSVNLVTILIQRILVGCKDAILNRRTRTRVPNEMARQTASFVVSSNPSHLTKGSLFI